MRTTVLAVLKLLTIGLLVAALVDVKIPGGKEPRTRVYLLDGSASVRVPGLPESLTPRDAWKLVASDAPRFDRVLVLEFGERTRVLHDGLAADLPAVPPGEGRSEITDLAEALRSALARTGGGDAVLFSDGRPTRGDLSRALFECRARGFPVHTVTIGPLEPEDARIVRLDAPAFVEPRTSFAVTVDVEASMDASVRVTLGDAAQEITLVRGVPRTVRFEIPGILARTEYVLRLPDDACPQNNEARFVVQPREERRRVLVLGGPGAAAILRAQPGIAVTESKEFRDPYEFDAVVLDQFSARSMTDDQQKRLRSFVTEFGGGLLALGGADAYGPGGYSDTPIEEVLPVWAFPDETLAIVFVLDRSGSMNQELPGGRTKLDAAKRAIENALRELRKRDLATVVLAPNPEPTALTQDRDAVIAGLQRVSAGGETLLVESIRRSIRMLDATGAPRLHILLLSDGETDESFTDLPDELKAFKVGLTWVLTGERPKMRLGENPIAVRDWDKLSAQIAELVRESLDPFASPKNAMQPAARHPAIEGIEALPNPRRVNRVSVKPGAELALEADGHPALAFRTAGRGRTGAAMFEAEHAEILVRSLEWVAPGRVSPWKLTCAIEGGEVVLSAVGPEDGPDELAVESERGAVRLERISRTGWRGRMPLPPPGSTAFRIPGSVGGTVTLLVPYAEEYAKIGADPERMARIARETGGVAIAKPADFQAGPEARWEPKSGRAVFLAIALALFLLDLGISTFWIRK